MPYGANFAIRRADALRFPFDPELGRQPSRPTRGWEEAVVIEQILAAKGTGHWLREAEVTHHIDASRQTVAYIRSYYFDIGYIDTMRKVHHFSRRRIVRRLARAIGLGMRFESAIVMLWLRLTKQPRALLLRPCESMLGRRQSIDYRFVRPEGRHGLAREVRWLIAYSPSGSTDSR